ncbi:uncharacterized protein LOC123527514 isoform X1 [Mercenaria mercenaria]|uniref:uncharacterized protein LOC123527514 isoform X1 n=1 Tax=Mercenaria mercenaria TaxID=6596 RepID=UPI00234EF907|nr:uncharacterized protein LOC123527514 isoform X1 [Mercenaria mercenaria]
MGLGIAEWAILLCFCAFGIQNSVSIVQQMREIEQNCFRDGGYCINTIPPTPPRRRNNNRRRGGGARGGAGGRMGTRTRTGSRPDPRALGAQHTRLPGSTQPAGGAPLAAGAPAYPPPARGAANNPPPPAGQTPTQQQNNGLFNFGSNPNDPYGSLFSMMMFTRKKRQAGVPEPHERPRRRQGQSMYAFLNQHCRKSEFDFGCRREGGMCCLPFLK